MTIMTRMTPKRMMLRRVSTADAKARLSELIGAVAFGRERIVIERRGRPVAVLVGIDDAEEMDVAAPEPPRRRGALALVGGWSDVEDAVLDDIVGDIYAARERDPGRAVDLSS